jgi:hypothetical protein
MCPVRHRIAQRNVPNHCQWHSGVTNSVVHWRAIDQQRRQYGDQCRADSIRFAKHHCSTYRQRVTQLGVVQCRGQCCWQSATRFCYRVFCCCYCCQRYCPSDAQFLSTAPKGFGEVTLINTPNSIATNHVQVLIRTPFMVSGVLIVELEYIGQAAVAEANLTALAFAAVPTGGGSAAMGDDQQRWQHCIGDSGSGIDHRAAAWHHRRLAGTDGRPHARRLSGIDWTRLDAKLAGALHSDACCRIPSNHVDCHVRQEQRHTGSADQLCRHRQLQRWFRNKVRLVSIAVVRAVGAH